MKKKLKVEDQRVTFKDQRIATLEWDNAVLIAENNRLTQACEDYNLQVQYMNEARNLLQKASNITYLKWTAQIGPRKEGGLPDRGQEFKGA
jgi:hypothetical protein